jgi:hypothetical protein
MDKSKLKELALAAPDGQWNTVLDDFGNFGIQCGDYFGFSVDTTLPRVREALRFIAAANPAAIIELLAENEQKEALIEEYKQAAFQMGQVCATRPSVDLSGLAELHKELNRITWEGEDEGWNLAITAVQKRIAEILATKAAQPAAGQVPDARSLHVDQPDEPQVDVHGRYFWRAGWNACRDSVLDRAVPPVPAAEQPSGPIPMDSDAVLSGIAHLARQAQAGAVVEASEDLRNRVQPQPLRYPLDAYWQAPSDVGPLAATYKDKPHRLIYDLIAALLAAPTLGSAPQAAPVAQEAPAQTESKE